MTAQEVMDRIRPLGSDGYKRILMNHGIPEPFFGVKVEELKKIQKEVKKDYRLALDLYDTGNYDAMYLAGLIADDKQMTVDDLKKWANTATCSQLCSSTVAWVASESHHGREVALEWIESDNANTAVAGWATLNSLVAIKDDADLDIAELRGLLERVKKEIHQAPNRVRSSMNNFVVSIGTHVKELSDEAMQAGTEIGAVYVDMGNTSCKVPFSPDYIQKARDKGTVGKKRKTAKC
jgi:3-methyladenine DNA glycosylase AlkD